MQEQDNRKEATGSLIMFHPHHNRGSCIVSHYSLHDTSADEKKLKKILSGNDLMTIPGQ